MSGTESKTARAMVIEAYNEPLAEREIRIPELREGEVLVRLLAAGVCGSDVHMWMGEDPRNRLPMIPGHEGVGVIEDMTSPLSDIAGKPLLPGARVIWDRGMPCGECWYCAVLKDPSLCPNRWAYGIAKPCSEFPYLNGCYASHIILRRNTKILSLDGMPDVDPAVLVSASCSGATTAKAFDLARPNVGDTVVIQGPGPLGVYGTDLARLSGAANIVVIGATPARMEMCRAMGATLLLDRKATTREERRRAVLDLTGGRGADLVLETAGTRDGIDEGLDLVRRGGTYLAPGVAVPIGPVEIDWFRQVSSRNIRIQGSWVSDTTHLVRAVSLVTSRPEEYGRLVTHRFPLTQAMEALRTVQRHESVKTVLVSPE